MKQWLVLLHIAWTGGDIDNIESYKDHYTVIGPLPPNYTPHMEIRNVAESGVFEARTAHEATKMATKLWGMTQVRV